MQQRTDTVSTPIATSTWKRKDETEEAYSVRGERDKQSWRRLAERGDIVLAISLLVKKVGPLTRSITRAFACVMFGSVATVLAPT
jgi:hypothetical protein